MRPHRLQRVESAVHMLANDAEQPADLLVLRDVDVRDAALTRLTNEAVAEQPQQVEGDVDAAALELLRFVTQSLEYLCAVRNAIARVLGAELFKTIGETNRFDLAHRIDDVGIVRAQRVHACQVLLADDDDKNRLRVCPSELRRRASPTARGAHRAAG